jgi:hypothetical protein
MFQRTGSFGRLSRAILNIRALVVLLQVRLDVRSWTGGLSSMCVSRGPVVRPGRQVQRICPVRVDWL